MQTSNEVKYGVRNSIMFLNEVYFWTDTIKDWKNLLIDDSCKTIVIESLKNLTSRKKIVVYSFVIMPNHLHIIWEMIAKNGKEMPHASFNKFTSHQFLAYLRNDHVRLISDYKVENDIERKHRFWQRDPLAIRIESREMVEQKLDYIHLNPLQEHWNLADKPENYYWSSAKFYEHGIDDFGFLTHYRDRV